MLQDARYALRVLGRNPGFTSAAILCLALGIGATTAIFSVVHTVVMKPLPYYEPERLTRIYTEFPTFPGGGLRKFWVSPPEFLELKRELQSYETIEGWTNGGVNLSGSSEPIRVTASNVSGGMLRMLGVSPILGRVHTQHDDVDGVPLAVVISEGLWNRAFGSDRNILGRSVQVNGQSGSIVGVMPKGFQFPPGEVDPPELWVPIQFNYSTLPGRGSHFLSLLARLKKGVTVEQSRLELNSTVQRHSPGATAKRHDFDPATHTLITGGLQEEVIGGVRPAMMMLLGAVCFVLLISCVNVANLLLARAESRRREIAVRKAIGAGVDRLLAQFITEGVILSLGGAVLGVLLAFGGLRLIGSSSQASIPRAAEIGIDWGVLGFTLAVSLATGIFFGLAPVAQLMAGNLHEGLKAAAGRTTASVSSHNFRRALVVTELALALVLLIGTGLMVRAFWKLQQVNVGLNPAGVLTVRVAIPRAVYKDGASTAAFWSNLQQRLDGSGNIESASMMTGLPPARPINANDTDIEGFVPTPGGPIQNVDYWNFVGPKYFETLRIPLIEGRLFDDRDAPNGTPTAVINQTMARTFWPGQSPVGRRLRPGGAEWRTVVGVVADVKNAGVDKPTGTELYLPLRQANDDRFPITSAYVVARSTQDPMSLASAIRRQVQAIDGSIPVSQIRTMEEVVSRSQSRPRFLTTLLTLFSSVALALAALGIYGVISYSVAQRTTEFGIRMAMGAQRKDVLRMVIGHGVRLGLAGMAIGAAGALVITRFIKGMLFGIDSFDPATFGFMAVTLVVVTIAACWIPARRATKVDPMIALRYE